MMDKRSQELFDPQERKWQKLLAEHIAVLPVLAGQLKGTAEQMEQAVSGLSSDLTAIASEARQHASHTAESLAPFAGFTPCGDPDASALVTQLRRENEAMRRAALRSMERNAALAQKLCDAVVTLQFQDIVSQRLQHVVQALVEIERSVYLHAVDLPEGAGKLSGHWAERLNGSYTTEAEKRFHAEHTGQLTPDQHNDENDVELF